MFWNIVIGLASFALNLILAPKPQNAKPAALTDFNVPVAEESREISIIFRTDRVWDPNIVWYGDYSFDGIKGPRRYGFFGPRVITGYKYYLGIHMVWCIGPVDSVKEVRVGEKVITDAETIANAF